MFIKKKHNNKGILIENWSVLIENSIEGGEITLCVAHMLPWKMVIVKSR